ncbi:hypothetical protein ABXT21_19790 [Ralstonia sp. SM1864_UCD524_TZ4]|uniref:HEPN AbiU2-like domain-containing protein n=1 Tax=Ralstonia solanacearum TaxID=305 RepID=A0A0S4X5Y2_RALSL|nr:hypothetical protein [Ralstonia pseudosolanacearum]CUV25959.1 conserved protein of unknown function [Ralstonia solanacearum]CUV35042.1 conserved protein of unknown function [Ralstonia solanacearum]CUV38484.1 conserved protein of unknown function [Ralstonia solanacearum]CUV59121.1 conserved protein of unknown function [Ralstonia solanacearum]
MKTDEQVVEALQRLRALVRAAEDEALLAVMLHESWKPTAYDVDLHARMGTSFATHTFNVVGMALRRELLLALARVWDTNKRAVRLTAISDTIRDEQCFDALVRERAESLKLDHAPVELMRQTLAPKRAEVLELIRKYMQDGERASVLESLRSLRHERLAHRQVHGPIKVAEKQATDEQIEALYEDTLEIVTRLLSLVLAHAFDIPNDAVRVYRHHARHFWAAVRGERTEGHPDFAKPER